MGKFLRFFLPKKAQKSDSLEHKEGVEKAAHDMLKKYQKTFKDLARYDREGRLTDKVSR